MIFFLDNKNLKQETFTQKQYFNRLIIKLYFFLWIEIQNMSFKNNRNLLEVAPIFSPRSSYKRIKATDEKMIADMTLNFDKLTINLLKQEFIQHDNELNLEQFIIIAKKHLKFWQNDIPNREIALMRYLTFLFNEIDINGNGDMEWDQFTNYIIEKATVLKNLKSKADQIKHYVRSKVKPKMKIDGIIQKSQYIDDMEKIAFFEEGSNRISFMNPDTGEISQKYITVDPKKLVVNISSVKKEKNGKVSIRKKDLVLPTDVRVLDMIYLSEKKYRVLLVSTSDSYVRGWRHSQNGFYIANQPDNEEEPFQHYFPSQIYCLAWDSINQVLYCGQKNGSIYMWNLKTDLEKPLCENKNTTNEKEYQEQKVNSMITSMITMPKLQFMASGRMDGKLILWDTINNKKKWTYGEHSRGILTLSFNEGMILLFSAGFDHKICIWNPYISTLIHKIEGHLAPILSLRVIQGTHQLVSVDTEGIVKITDTRRFNFIYSFSVESTEQGTNSCALSSLLVVKKPLKLVFTGKSIYIYEYDKNYHPHIVDENTAICCKYIKQKLCLFTPTGNKIKVWSALNGDVERIYMDITPFQISTFQFDYLKKRMVVGDTKGNITLHNTANGAKMKSLAKHNGQITHLIATQNDTGVDIFISCALDNQIRIFKETEESYEIIRAIYLRKDVSVTCLSYCSETKLIMVGSNVGTLAFYDIETGKTAGTCLNRSYEEFTGITKTKQSMIVTCSSSGKISIIALPPLPNRFEKIFSFHHEDPEKGGSSLGVRTISYSNSLKSLFLIDDKMYLSCYSFMEIDLEQTKQINQKVESIRRSLVIKLFQGAKINLKWQFKAHNEVIKSLQYIEDQQLIVTCSFDKKVKLWSAESGEYIDSLQQNYNKSEVTPIGYYDRRNFAFYTPDFKGCKTVGFIDPVNVQYDPFAFEKVFNEHPELAKAKHSNKQWKVFVDFRDIAVEEMDQFRQLAERIKQVQGSSKEVSKAINKIKISEIKNKLNEQKRLLKDIKNIQEHQFIDSDFINLKRREEKRKNNEIDTSRFEDKEMSEAEKLQEMAKKMIIQQNPGNKRVSVGYFRRSAMKCLQNYVESCDGDIETCEKSTKKKTKVHHDYVPIYQVLKNREKTKEQLHSHRRYIEDLYKRGTQSSNNGRYQQKIVLGRKEADAARKFYRMLSKTDEKDKRIEQIAQNIFVKDKQKFPFPKLHA